MNVAESRDALTVAQLAELAWDAGRSLGQIHGFTFDAFGALRSLADDPFPTWADYVRDYAQA